MVTEVRSIGDYGTNTILTGTVPQIGVHEASFVQDQTGGGLPGSGANSDVFSFLAGGSPTSRLSNRLEETTIVDRVVTPRRGESDRATSSTERRAVPVFHEDRLIPATAGVVDAQVSVPAIAAGELGMLMK